MNINKAWIEQKREDVQCSGLDRVKFPNSEKGTIAKDKWNDPIFCLGMEYGYLFCLKEIKEEL